MIHWNADPILLQLGPLAIHWYGVLFAGGFLLGYQIMQWIYRREGHPTEQLDKLLTFIFIGTVLGARLAHVVFYEPAYYFSNPWEILKIWKGGLASHGGTLGVLLAILIFVRQHSDVRLLWLLDRLAIPTALTACFIRLGNFMNSEIVGLPTDGSWGVVFEKVDMLPRHPVQLYEAGGYLLTFILLLVLYRLNKMQREGLAFGLFMTLIFGSRFLLEFFKTPQAAYEVGYSISVGQWLSVPFILLGILMMLRAKTPRI
ncbi:MAG: prolipoprotein diacylglyceryl transferase [Aeromonadaceae bacterium]|nr:prolipoprotein diacylglyceryl transferase [Aeromonadaceae bacterium]MBP8771985.1 prolipoprotein diacylglyceryl transferase [Aeromonadaceae bacterium]